MIGRSGITTSGPLTQQRSFKQGDAVWLHNLKREKGLRTKLQRPWDGLYIVTKCIDDLVYRTQKGARGKLRVLHTNRLKRYEGADVPDLFQDVPEEHARVAEGAGRFLGLIQYLPTTCQAPFHRLGVQRTSH